MKRLPLKALIFWNISAFALAQVAPMPWIAPLIPALTVAAGLSGAGLAVLPGAVAGCLCGAGGAGAIIACLAAWAGGECQRRVHAQRDVFLALWAFLCTLIPALMRYASRGAYSLFTAIAISLVALAAAPVWATMFARELIARAQLSSDERIALNFLAAAVISGLCRLFAPLGLFAAGAFVLFSSGEGVLTACTAAFPAALALILGGCDILPAGLLLVCAGAAGLGRAQGRWLQALLFLSGLPLLFYFEGDLPLIALFCPAVAYPLLPEQLCVDICSRFYAHTALHAPPFRVMAARRHLPVRGQSVSGDAGAIDYLPGNRVLLLLADGMGTGPAARRLSERAIREARRLLRASLDEPTVYRALNRLLLSGENHFSTLETCVIDLERGLASFHKSGSETAWIVRGQRVKRLSGSALPLGIVPEAPPSAIRVALRPGDTIFLATDGLVSALKGEKGTERALLSLIHHSPEEICAQMMRRARPSTAHPDDMSALCARLVERLPAESQSQAS